jgi:hypothetical protein
VDLVLEATLCIVAFVGLHISDLGLVEQLMMKTEDLLVLTIRWLRRGCGSHDCAVGSTFGVDVVDEAIKSRGKGERCTTYHPLLPSMRATRCIQQQQMTIPGLRAFPIDPNRPEMVRGDAQRCCLHIEKPPVRRTDQKRANALHPRSALRRLHYALEITDAPAAYPGFGPFTTTI